MTGKSLKHRFGMLLATASILLAACTPAVSRGAGSSPATTVAATTTLPSAPSTATTTPPLVNVSAYFVGNSLTNGTLGLLFKDVRSFVPLARQADYLVRPLGWHIKCGSSLVSIATNPEDTCVDPVDTIGTFSEALASQSWNFLVVQPYPGADSTLATDIEVISNMAKMAPPSTTVLVFTGWPQRTGFAESWDSANEVTDDTPTEHSRRYFDTLLDRLGEVLDQEVKLVPVGEVLYRLQPLLDAGDIPGIANLAGLYSDDVHLDARGNWISGVTLASVLTETDPAEFGKPPEPWYGTSDGWSKELITLTRQVVAEVLDE